MNRDFLVDALTDLGIAKGFHVELLEKYYERVTEKNKVMNLTSITGEREFVIKHICDSAAPLLFLDLRNKKCIDVGTGGGFPGIPLRIIEGSLSMDYVESVGKKADFVAQTAEELGLGGRVYVKRAEDMGRDKTARESYDAVFARAVSGLNVLAEYCTPLLKPGGILAAYKGPDPKEEIDGAHAALDELHCRMDRLCEYELPYTDIKHTLVVIKKHGSTPADYPRPTAKIKRRPL